ncbi:MAG TPA: universal stress protein UspA [Clostridiales bacterium]|nr:universal stress protein UspA [Clostridiales bacterium]
MLANNNIMVCVTQQKTCERLIEKGNGLLQNDVDQLFVIHVVNENDKFLHDYSDGDALEYLFGITKVLGAELIVRRSKNVINTIVDFAKKNDIGTIVMGKSSDKKNPFEEKLRKKLKEVEILIV